jgi:SAM-dependent methyltransferase
MPTDSIAFDGSIPALYDRHLGPLIFEPYARDLARRVADAKPRRVLEVACGSGRVTRQLHAMLPRDVEIVASDFSASMLAFARSTLPDATRVTWREADGMALPFDDGAFDVVACQFGLMFFPDPAAGMRELARVVAPGGQLLVSTWDSMLVNGFARVVHERVTAMLPDDPPQFMHVPFHLHDRVALHGMAMQAGLASAEVLALPTDNDGVSARDAARGFVRGNPMSVQLEQRGADLDAIEGAVATGLAELGGEAPLHLHLHAILVHGTQRSAET